MAQEEELLEEELLEEEEVEEEILDDEEEEDEEFDEEESDEEEDEDDEEEEDIELDIDGKKVPYSELVDTYRKVASGKENAGALSDVATFFEKDDFVKFVANARKQGYSEHEITSVLAKTLLQQAQDAVEEAEENEDELGYMTAEEKKVYLENKRIIKEMKQLKAELEQERQERQAMAVRQQNSRHNDSLLYKAMDDLGVEKNITDKDVARIIKVVPDVLGDNGNLQLQKITERQAQTIIKLAFGEKDVKQKSTKKGVDAATRQKLLKMAGRQVPGKGAKTGRGSGKGKNPEKMTQEERLALLRSM